MNRISPCHAPIPIQKPSTLPPAPRRAAPKRARPAHRAYCASPSPSPLHPPLAWSAAKSHVASSRVGANRACGAGAASEAVPPNRRFFAPDEFGPLRELFSRRSHPAPSQTAAVPHVGGLENALLGGLAPLEGSHLLRHAEAQARVRARMPGIVKQFFPLDNSSMSNYYAARSVAFCLNRAAERITEPNLLAFVRKMAPVFEDFANVISARAGNNMQACTQLVRDVVQPRLAMGCAFLLEGGFADIHAPERGLHGDGHAAALWFTPWAPGQTLCAVVDRGQGLEDLLALDTLHRPQPTLMLLPTAALLKPAGLKALTALLMLQYEDPQQVEPRYADTFHQGAAHLMHACTGTLLLGRAPFGTQAQRLIIPGQQPQKAGTCAVHCLLGVLHLALHQAYGTLSLDTSAYAHRRRAYAQNTYKALKFICRSIILEEAVSAWEHAEASGDKAYQANLAAALQHAARYLGARLAVPHKRAQELLQHIPPRLRLSL